MKRPYPDRRNVGQLAPESVLLTFNSPNAVPETIKSPTGPSGIVGWGVGALPNHLSKLDEDLWMVGLVGLSDVGLRDEGVEVDAVDKAEFTVEADAVLLVDEPVADLGRLSSEGVRDIAGVLYPVSPLGKTVPYVLLNMLCALQG